MNQRYDIKLFFHYVIPSVLSFALSGVYSIVDGFFVGNSVGDLGLSTINIAYPIVALIQSFGTGIGMGGAICYAIRKAEKKEGKARDFSAGALWILLLSGFLLTVGILLLNRPLLRVLGAKGELLSLGEEYISIIALGAGLQILGTGLVPFIRNHGGSFYAMASVIAGFAANIFLDYLFVWVFQQGVAGAALATVIGQGITMLAALAYLLYKKQLTLRIPYTCMGSASASILKTGTAPFGLAMAPNITLILVNRFSILYGGEKAIAVYACISYMICILYLILQGVGDGSQPLMSRYYGEGNSIQQGKVRNLAYIFSMLLSVLGCIVLYTAKGSLGLLFGASNEVSQEVAATLPIFLLSAPLDAFNRVTTASFYATDKSTCSYLLTFCEPLFMLAFMGILPPLFGGQAMIWWSTVFAKLLTAFFALAIKLRMDKQGLPASQLTGKL